MLKFFSSLLPSALISACLCVVFALPTIAQVPTVGQARSNTILLTIERSEESFQKGEQFFQTSEYAQARSGQLQGRQPPLRHRHHGVGKAGLEPGSQLNND